MSKPIRFNKKLLPEAYGMFLINGVDKKYFREAVIEGYNINNGSYLVHDIIYSYSPMNPLFDKLISQREGMMGIVTNRLGDVIAVGINQGGVVKWR